MNKYLHRIFLTTLVLVMGNLSSAWADTETVTVLSEDYESYEVGDITSVMQGKGWTFNSKNNKNQIKIVQGAENSANPTKYFDFYYPDGGASRNQSWNLNVESSLTADNWTFSFSAALNPGANNSANKFWVVGTKSGKVTDANADVTNPLLSLIGTAAAAVTYTPSIGGTAYENIELTSGTWYDFTITATNVSADASTADITVKIAATGGTVVFNQSVQGMSMASIGTLRGFCWNSPRGNSRLSLDNVLLTKEVDASVCAAPQYEITGVAGTARKFTLTCETAGSTIYYATSELEKGAAGWNTYAAEVTTEAATIYAYAEKGATSSDIISFETGAGAAIQLNAPTLSVAELISNGDVYNVKYNATYNAAGVEFTPAATLVATFNGTEVTLPYTVTENGTLVITANADGYESASAELAVKANYVKGWTSTDYSTLTDENVATVLGEDWAKIDATGRWASWTADKEPYTYYQHGDDAVHNVTIEENVRIRSVVLLNMGYGLSRNVANSEAISFLNTTAGTIAEVKYYAGYGKDITEENTKFEYLYNAGEGISSFGCNNGKVLMQVAYYAPKLDLSTVIANGDFEGEHTVYSNPKNDRAIYQPAGWNITYENGEENDMTALNSNSLAWNSFSGQPQPTNGGNNTYWVRFRWGNSEQLTLSQTVTLPAGEYRMTADAFFNGADGGSATISAAGVSTNITGNKTWANYAVDFTLEESTDVTFAFNLKQTKQVENIAAFDNFKLGRLSDVLLEALTAELATAEALKTEARTEGLADFEAAIQAASAVATTSQDAAAISAAIEALKQAEQTFLTANLPVAEGTYYIYNPLTKKFLSRGNDWGTSAVVDDYGVAINVTVTDLPAAKYTLSSFDNNLTYGDDAWMYVDCSGDRTRAYNINMVEDGITLTNTNNSQLVYVYLKEDGNKYRVAGNAIKDGNYTDDAQTVWQLISKDERDQIVAAREAAQKTAAFEAAQIAEDADIETGEATELTFKNGHTWTQTVVRTQDNQPATNANGTEMWQATGSYAQTVEGLESGLYRVTIQAFYRNGSSDEDQARVATGYNTVLAYLDANGSKVQVKSWTSDKGEGNDPNSMPEAAAKFADGKYLSEGYAYVGEDGKLALTVNNPAHIGNGWFIVGNVKYAKVDKKAAKPGDITGDGDVTTGDAVAVVDFILEKSQPTEEQFKAADVNNDEVLTVSDAVGIVSIALGAWDGVLANGARSLNAFDYAGNYLFVDGTDVALVSSTSFVGFQMDVTLSEGALLNGVQLSQRTMGHEVVWNRVGQRTWRIVVLSMGNDVISPAEGTLLHLDITGDQQVSVVSNEFTNAQLQGYHLQLGQPTGINAIQASDADTRIFNAAGQQSDKLRKGMNIVVDRNGKTVKMLRK